MPALPAVPGALRIAFKGTLGVRSWATIMHVKTGLLVPASQAQVDALASVASTAFRTRFLPSMSSSVSLTETSVTDLFNDTGLTGLDTTAGAGTQVGNMSSPQVTFLLNWKVARRYRGGHSRTYLAGVAENDVDNTGLVLAARGTALTTACGTFMSDLASGAGVPSSTQLAVVHYYKNGSLQTSPAVDTILSGRCSSQVATQRRRLRG